VVTPNTYNIRTQYTNRQPAQLQSQQSSPVGIGPSWLLLSNEKGQYPISHFGLLSSQPNMIRNQAAQLGA
jgi:hypothetical protein